MFKNFLNGKDSFTIETSTVNGYSTLTFSVNRREQKIYIFKEGLIKNFKNAEGSITTDGFEIKYTYKETGFTIFFTQKDIRSDKWCYKIVGDGEMIAAYINSANVLDRLTKAL